MGRAKHLTNAEKRLIAFNYKESGKSLSAIASFLGRDVSSVSRYKNYKILSSAKVIKTIVDLQKWELLFNEVYHYWIDRGKLQNYIEEPSNENQKYLFYDIAQPPRQHKDWKEIPIKCPLFRGLDKNTSIKNFIDILVKNYQNGNEKVILPPVK